MYCFRPRRYKTFESYSQRYGVAYYSNYTVSDREDTKLLKAIHNWFASSASLWLREDTKLLKAIHNWPQLVMLAVVTVSDREDTKLLKAIHNVRSAAVPSAFTVSDREDTKLLKAIHNISPRDRIIPKLFQTAKIQNF